MYFYVENNRIKKPFNKKIKAKWKALKKASSKLSLTSGSTTSLTASEFKLRLCWLFRLKNN